MDRRRRARPVRRARDGRTLDQPRFFRPSPTADARGRGARRRAADRTAHEWQWADTIQLLLEHGHSMTEIRGYTVAQVRAFVRAIGRAERRRRRNALLDARASQMTGKGFEQYLKHFDGES